MNTTTRRQRRTHSHPVTPAVATPVAAPVITDQQQAARALFTHRQFALPADVVARGRARAMFTQKLYQGPSHPIV